MLMLKCQKMKLDEDDIILDAEEINIEKIDLSGSRWYWT